MAEDDAAPKPPPPGAAPRKRPDTAQPSDKEARLAAALRANLRRRKAPDGDGGG